MKTLETVWRLWPTVAAMAAETDSPAPPLYRARAAGRLPDAALDLAIIARARAAGVSLTLDEIAVARWRAAGSPGARLVAGVSP